MPLPTPKKNESQNQFVSRCVQALNDNNEFKDNKQRVAVCYQQWKNKDKKKTKASIEDRLSEELKRQNEVK